MQIDQIRRDAIDLSLRSARLPLTVAEQVLGRGHDTSTWPAVRLYDKVEAGVKELVGRVVNDDQLQAAARLQRSEVTKREDAMAKRARAEAIEQDAETTAAARRDELEAERAAIEEADDERQRQIEEAEREAHERAAREAEAKKASTRTTAAKRKRAVETRATRSEAERLRAEAKALAVEDAAVEARGEALELDKAVQAKKSARRAT